MSELDERIAELSNSEAIQAAAYVAECLRQKLQATLDAPITLDDNQAAVLLSEAFPAEASAVSALRPTSGEAVRGEAGRQFLSACAEEKDYAAYVQDGLDQLAFKCDPLTFMAVAAGIVFLMQLKFHADGEVKGKRGRFGFSIGKDPTSEAMLRRIIPPVSPQ